MEYPKKRRIHLYNVHGPIHLSEFREEEFRFGGPNVVPENVPRKIINGVAMPIQEHRGVYKVMCSRDYAKRIEAMEHITRHLMEIFKIANFHLDTNMFAELKLSKSFIFKVARTFSDIEIDMCTVSKDEVKLLLKEIQVDNMKLDVGAGDDAMEGIPLKHRKIKFGIADWLPFSSLLDMQCEKLELMWDMHKLNSNDLLKLIGKWSDGNLENLKSLNVKIFYSSLFHVQEQLRVIAENVFFELQSMSLVVEIEDKEMTIQRNDGKRAKIILEVEDNIVKIVNFLVF